MPSLKASKKEALWCQWDTTEQVGMKREYCLKPIKKGETYCEFHHSRLPLWA